MCLKDQHLSHECLTSEHTEAAMADSTHPNKQNTSAMWLPAPLSFCSAKQKATKGTGEGAVFWGVKSLIETDWYSPLIPWTPTPQLWGRHRRQVSAFLC